MTPEEQAQLDADNRALAVARDKDTEADYQTGLPKVSGLDVVAGAPQWLKKLPRNVGIGLLDAAMSANDAIDWFGRQVVKNTVDPSGLGEAAQRAEGKGPEIDAAAQKLEEERKAAHDPAKSAYWAWRDEVAQGSTLSDGVVQSISQYAIPFLGFSKLLGGLKGASTLGTVARVAGAEAATAATVLPSDAPRAADLLAMARHVEGKMGEAMLAVAPDGSLLNKYIDWMTDRTNETETEGRFKNVVDNLVLSAAGAGLFKTAAMTLKSGRFVINEALGPVPRQIRQGGAIFNNASGESKASLEAQNRLKVEKAAGQTRYRIGPDDSVTPIIGVDGVDAVARDGELIVQRGIGASEWTPLSKGANVKDAHVKGRIAAVQAKLDEIIKKE